MRQELYFDGILMDIDESTKITLVIKSNIFTEISKCVGNRTYSVQLPKTARNQRILEFAHLPAANTNSNIPYRYLQCRYVRNGIEIFSDGYAYIISAKEKIEVCIVWGTPAVLRAIFADGLKLNEIPDDGKKAPYVRYNEVTQSGEIAYQDGYCYAAIDFLKYEGFRNSGDIYNTPEAQARWPKMGYLRPCVLLRYILDRLYTQYGINFVLDYETALWVLHLMLPCVSDNVSDVYPALKSVYVGNELWSVTQESLTVFPYNPVGFEQYPFMRSYTIVKTKISVQYSMSFRKECDENELRRLINNGLIGVRPYYNGASAEYKKADIIHVIDTNNQVWDINSGTNRTDNWYITAIGSVMDMEVDASSYAMTSLFVDNHTMSELYAGEETFTPTVEEMMYGIDFPLTPNLPDMKVTDFLQWVSAITGTFPRQTDKGNIVLEFVHYHKLFDNKSIALDWSDKLVRAYDDGAPREINFTVDGWAQVNHFAYGNSKDVGDFADGKVVISNVQLDEEQDVVGDVFDALQYPNNVPTYKTNADDNAERLLAYLFPSEDETDEPLEADNPEPCVLHMQPLEINNVAYVQGVFDDTLYWRNILQSDRYAGLIRSLQKAKILHEVFALTELDIKQFDETVPVYLAQYGHYYAVTEIKTSETGVAEVTLFQLEL